jgi:hypothetical protein
MVLTSFPFEPTQEMYQANPESRERARSLAAGTLPRPSSYTPAHTPCALSRTPANYATYVAHTFTHRCTHPSTHPLVWFITLSHTPASFVRHTPPRLASVACFYNTLCMMAPPLPAVHRRVFPLDYLI